MMRRPSIPFLRIWAASPALTYSALALFAASLLVIASPGCSSLDLLEGKLPGSDDTDIGLQSRPYPKLAAKGESLAPIVQSPAIQSVSQSAPVAPPAQLQPPPPVSAPLTPTAPPSPVVAVLPTPPPTSPQPTAAEIAASKLPPPPLESVAGPEQEKPEPPKQGTPVSGNKDSSTDVALVAHNTKSDSPPKVELTSQQRLAALHQQRGQYLKSLAAEVERRRSEATTDEELARLEQELRLIHLSAEEPDAAIAEIDALEPAEREAFKHLAMSLSTWMDPDEARRAAARNTKVLRELRSAASELASAAKLDVKTLTFCEKVESYGWYTEFTKTQFKPKQEVILYVEVENFTSQRLGDEQFETELQGSYQIFDSRGNLVDERELPLDKEICRNQRRDYFLTYRIYMPDKIEPGGYRLELTIEDLKAQSAERGQDKENPSYKGRKLGQGLIEFTVR